MTLMEQLVVKCNDHMNTSGYVSVAYIHSKFIFQNQYNRNSAIITQFKDCFEKITGRKLKKQQVKINNKRVRILLFEGDVKKVERGGFRIGSGAKKKKPEDKKVSIRVPVSKVAQVHELMKRI